MHLLSLQNMYGILLLSYKLPFYVFCIRIVVYLILLSRYDEIRPSLFLELLSYYMATGKNNDSLEEAKYHQIEEYRERLRHSLDSAF